MFTPITFPSALQVWLSYQDSRILTEDCGERSDHPSRPAIKNNLLDIARAYGIKDLMHIMVPKSSLRNCGKPFVGHVMPKNLPKGSFVKLSEFVDIVSPELCFLLAAKTMSVVELTALACDLSGIYAKNEYAECGQVSRESITSVEKIAAYVNKAKRIDGLKKARIAVQYALNCSNSPMESKLAAIIVLRYLYGGYSMMKPKLNALVPLSKAGASHLKKEQCCCDIVWQEQKIVAEYDSDLAHLSPGQVHYDKRRTTALQLSGYTVISITRDVFRNFNTIEELFLLIQKSLGMKINKKALERNKEVRKDAVKRLFLMNHGF